MNAARSLSNGRAYRLLALASVLALVAQPLLGLLPGIFYSTRRDDRWHVLRRQLSYLSGDHVAAATSLGGVVNKWEPQHLAAVTATDSMAHIYYSTKALQNPAIRPGRAIRFYGRNS